jgi:lysophospholipase L1-like esterase
VNALQQALDVDGLVTVDATPLKLQADGLHLTLESNIAMGHMLAEALVPLVRAREGLVPGRPPTEL